MEFVNKIKAKALAGSLCLKCANGTIVVGETQERVYCGYFDKSVEFIVKECSSFRNRYSVTLSQMEELAWILKTDKSKSFVGFERPKEDKKTKISHMFD